MTGLVTPGAPNASEANVSWKQLCWQSIEKNVYRLQVRIAKAVRNKQYGKVKSLQWLLVNSASAKLLAVKRVTTTKGSKTPGIDGVVWNTPEEKYQAACSLKTREYKALPLRKTYIPKKNGKQRPLSIPSDKVNYVRYADDFIVTAKNPDILKEKVTPIINAFLAQRELSLSKDKPKLCALKIVLIFSVLMSGNTKVSS
jgi:N-terminal domain of reverse transcriptase